MTEREKMLAGELYSPADPELRKLHLRAKKLFSKYNKISATNEKNKINLLKNSLEKREKKLEFNNLFIAITGVILALEKIFLQTTVASF